MTQKLTYDHNDHLLMIETSDEQLYVACDQLGSPVLLFKTNGNVVKHIKYGPWGGLVEDSQPSMNIPLGYRGGVSSIHAAFVHLQIQEQQSSQCWRRSLIHDISPGLGSALWLQHGPSLPRLQQPPPLQPPAS